MSFVWIEAENIVVVVLGMGSIIDDRLSDFVKNLIG